MKVRIGQYGGGLVLGLWLFLPSRLTHHPGVSARAWETVIEKG
jgi:hypothetical protein